MKSQRVAGLAVVGLVLVCAAACTSKKVKYVYRASDGGWAVTPSEATTPDGATTQTPTSSRDASTPGAAGDSVTFARCLTPTDCPAGDYCLPGANSGVCSRDCATDEPCAPLGVCVDGTCRPNCRDDVQCSAGFTCRGGLCDDVTNVEACARFVTAAACLGTTLDCAVYAERTNCDMRPYFDCLTRSIDCAAKTFDSVGCVDRLFCS
jgi:hypothetical protein